jgi:hypothetical protein
MAARLCNVADATGGWEGSQAAPPRISGPHDGVGVGSPCPPSALFGNIAGSMARWTDAVERACVDN